MAISNWTAFRVSSRIPVAPFQTINRFSEIVVVLIGWTVLSEGLTIFQFIGATILLVAAFLAIWAPVKNADASFKHLPRTSVMLTLISATTLGIGLGYRKVWLPKRPYWGICRSVAASLPAGPHKL